MPHHTHPAEPQQSLSHPYGRLGLHQLRPAAAELILLGDLTGRYATGSYSRLSSDGRTLVLREDRQGAAEHGHRITAAIACHVTRAGGTADQLAQFLLHPEHEGGRHARNIALRSGQARALDYIRRVWASATAVVNSTVGVESRHHAHEVLAALRDRIETTPWRGERGHTALRVLRAHLNFAEIAGGPLHHSSERQTAEEAGISRTTLRVVYETVLKPRGWLRRLRVGHGREGSTWYLDDGSTQGHRSPTPQSRFRTTQYPPDPALEEWPTPETATTADIDSAVIARLMGHDAFARHGLGSSALMIIGALHIRPAQTAGELVGAASVSRATAYRTLRRLADHGLLHHTGETWTLAAQALEGFGNTPLHAVNGRAAQPAQGWDEVARRHGTVGLAARRKALHALERVAYREALDQRAEHRSPAAVIVRDGRQVLVPAPRPDEIPSAWHGPGGRVLDPATGRTAPGWRVATDGRLILTTPADQRTYDELAAAHAEALSEWESTA
ncbi:helix-turn-helix domain-containing protein [Streptomyces phaeochromogenes]|uniref:helix-turn-helix domain-containing protein n=1 Tax=Streptomyces phaeochromogenes TaxID=1923 RepID=UPI003870BA67|nr:helix-turn-helix domain-containing protein [Streptomyces phaeochromogenes]